MTKFIVYMGEVHVQDVLIEADSKEDAIKKVQKGEGDYAFFEYSHTLEPDTWTVEEDE